MTTPQTELQESAKLREARKDLNDFNEYEAHYLGTRIEDVRELNGRIYYDKWTRSQKGYDVTVYRFDGIGDKDFDTADGLVAKQYVKEEEVGWVINGETEWDSEQAAADHVGEER